MNQSDIEAKFLDVLENDLNLEHDKERTEYGELVITIQSPCKDIGYLKVKIEEREITFTCLITHTHFDRNYYKRCGEENPTETMVNEAVDALINFINEKTCVYTEVGHDGRKVCTGWGGIDTYNKDLNESYLKLIEEQHGGPSTYNVFTWNKY